MGRQQHFHRSVGGWGDLSMLARDCWAPLYRIFFFFSHSVFLPLSALSSQEVVCETKNITSTMFPPSKQPPSTFPPCQGKGTIFSGFVQLNTPSVWEAFVLPVLSQPFLIAILIRNQELHWRHNACNFKVSSLLKKKKKHANWWLIHKLPICIILVIPLGCHFFLDYEEA